MAEKQKVSKEKNKIAHFYTIYSTMIIQMITEIRDI